MNSELARSSTVSRRVRVPLVALMLASAASPRATSALELVSHSSSGKAGTTDAGSPDSTNASIGVVASLTGPPSAPLIAFQSKAKDFVASGVDVNGMSDVFLYDTAQGKVVDLLSVATNGKAGCAGTASCTDGGSYRPALAPSSIANVVVFESDAHNLTAGALPRLTNAQTQIYARNFGSDTTTLVTASAQNASKGAVGKASDAATGGGLK